jgi:hypothetical protein
MSHELAVEGCGETVEKSRVASPEYKPPGRMPKLSADELAPFKRERCGTLSC